MEKIRTIHGMPLSKIMEELAADISGDIIKTRDYDGIAYITVDTYRKQLDTVVGVDHYNEYYTEPVVVQTKNTYGIMLKGTIELLDDNYEPVLRKECAGATTVNFANLTGVENRPLTDENGEKLQVNNATNFANDVKMACQDAFKSICRKFLIGEAQLKKAKMGHVYNITFLHTTSYVEKGLFADVKCDDPEVKRFAVFKNKMEQLKNVYPNGFMKGQKIAVYGSKKEDKRGNLQIIFEKLAESNPSAESQKVTVTATTASAVTDIAGKNLNCVTICIKENDTAVSSMLYFNAQSMEIMKKHGKWDDFYNNAANGITLTFYAEKKGNNYLFLDFVA